MSLLASIAGPLVTSLFASRASRRSRQAELQSRRTQFVELRDAAKLGNFNPLTALQATGTAGFGTAPGAAATMASNQAISGAIGSIAETLTSSSAINLTRERAAFNQMKWSTEAASGLASVGVAAPAPGAARIEPRSGLRAAPPAASATSAGGAGPSNTGAQAPSPAARQPWFPRANLFNSPAFEHIRDNLPGRREARPGEQLPPPDVNHIMMDFVHPNGSIVSLPAGPDADEVLTGSVMLATPAIEQNPGVSLGLAAAGVVGGTAAGTLLGRSGFAVANGIQGGAARLVGSARPAFGAVSHAFRPAVPARMAAFGNHIHTPAQPAGAARTVGGTIARSLARSGLLAPAHIFLPRDAGRYGQNLY